MLQFWSYQLSVDTGVYEKWVIQTDRQVADTSADELTKEGSSGAVSVRVANSEKDTT
jgi:hypothetical protein